VVDSVVAGLSVFGWSSGGVSIKRV
jgi:hypothetical protein